MYEILALRSCKYLPTKLYSSPPTEDCNIHIHSSADLKSHIHITYFVHHCLEDWNSIPGLGMDYSHHHVHNSSQSIQPSVPWAQGDPFFGQGRRSVKMTIGHHRSTSLRIRKNCVISLYVFMTWLLSEDNPLKCKKSLVRLSCCMHVCVFPI